MLEEPVEVLSVAGEWKRQRGHRHVLQQSMMLTVEIFSTCSATGRRSDLIKAQMGDQRSQSR